MFVPNLCDFRGGALLKQSRLLLAVLTAGLFSAAAWADGIDPKVIIQKGSGSTPITLTDPNPSVTSVAHANTESNPCFLATSTACVSDVFQNQTGKTITFLDIFVPAVQDLVFACGDLSDLLFFDHCNTSEGNGGTHVDFFADGLNGFNGVVSATQQCVPDSLIDVGLSLLSKNWCQKLDPEDFKWVGGEFALDIEGADLPPGTTITAQAITTPEPGAGLMVLFGALALGLFKLVRRAV